MHLIGTKNQKMEFCLDADTPEKIRGFTEKSEIVSQITVQIANTFQKHA